MDTKHFGNTPNEDRVTGNWKLFKGKLRERWGDLTDDELDRLQGQRDQLIGRLQERSGRERAEIERDIDSLSRDTNYAW
jgi:uncharacterized protein YjbJ (UPF0337 family)